jgi:hypothetical protein
VPAVLAWEDFHKQLISAAQKFDRSSNVLASAQAEVTHDDVQRELRQRIYVRQLQVVNCLDKDLTSAVNDYLRAAVDRTTWSERGDVLEDSFHEFQDGLERSWQSQQTRVEIEQKAAAEEDRGRLLHAHCMGLRIPLQGKEVPAYFVPGSFHTMADSLSIGWHPRYRDVLAPPSNAPTTQPTQSNASHQSSPEEGGEQ